MNLYFSILPWLLLFLVNISLIIRRIGKLDIPAWSAFMLAAVLLTENSSGSFDHSIGVIVAQIDVFIFLFGMFIIVNALEMSGKLYELSTYTFSRIKTPGQMLFFIAFGFGIISSVLINDTVAILAPIMIITIAKQRGQDPKFPVLLIAYAVSFGSALLPTGNPQNFILATAGDISFLQFFLMSIVPTIWSLFWLYVFFSRKKFLNTLEPFSNGNNKTPSESVKPTPKDENLGIWAQRALIIIFIGLIISSFSNISMASIILIVSVLFLFFRNERDELVGSINWGIFIFFAGMFVVIDAVVNTPLFTDTLIPWFQNLDSSYTSYVVFVITIFLLSQVLSNVPVAVLIAEILPGSQLDQPIFWVAAAISSTFAGSTTVLGAASNIIVMETGRKHGVLISWIEFVKYGIPISLIGLSGVLFYGYFFFL